MILFFLSFKQRKRKRKRKRTFILYYNKEERRK